MAGERQMPARAALSVTARILATPRRAPQLPAGPPTHAKRRPPPYRRCLLRIAELAPLAMCEARHTAGK